jgi:uncharacterized protein (TIGR03000 family)
MFRRYIFGFATALVLAAAALLLVPEASYAQRRGGGVRGGAVVRGGVVARGGGWYGGVARGGWYGGWNRGGWYGGWNRGYYPYWGGGWYGGSYRPYYGYSYPSYGYSYPSYGYSYPYGYADYSAPNYAYSYTPGYSYSTPSNPYSYAPSIAPYLAEIQSYQSLYPPSSTTGDTRAHVQVNVPSNAQVWFEGTLTQQGGMSRTFESPELMPGRTYTYHIRARWMDNGQPRDQTRLVTVHAGQLATVDFNRPSGS